MFERTRVTTSLSLTCFWEARCSLQFFKIRRGKTPKRLAFICIKEQHRDSGVHGGEPARAAGGGGRETMEAAELCNHERERLNGLVRLGERERLNGLVRLGERERG